MPAPRQIKRVVLFGGGGLVGFQIARRVAKQFIPNKIVLCALTREEAEVAQKKLKGEFPNIEAIDIEYGNLFVRNDFSQSSREEIAGDHKALNQIYSDVFEKIDESKDNIGQQNMMGQIILKHKPDVVVDCINTATGISYQDVKSSSQVVKDFHNNLYSLIHKNEMTKLISKAEAGDKESLSEVVAFAKQVVELSTLSLESFPKLNNMKMVELLLISQAVPQLVRHVTLLHDALKRAGTQMYVKVGTTGTGGMGVNIPYTHGEDKPSFTLMAKSSVGFAHTGLLFLLARSPGPIIKEIKPGAMIGYRRVDRRPIKKFRNPVKRWESKKETLATNLVLRQNAEQYQAKGDLELIGIDTGENGFFTRAEFEAITYMYQMEFVTPEEIAQNVIFEICGDNTGKDVIAAIDGAVMDPSYRAGCIRQNAIDEMEYLEEKEGIPSIAIGELGPPQLSKLLYETYLLQRHYPTLEALVSDKLTAQEMAQTLEKHVLDDEIQGIITSLGLPILLSDGKTILRGPSINIPESKVHAKVAINSSDDVDQWAKQGWVDLRKENMEVWKKRAQRMLESQTDFAEGSARFNPGTYMSKVFKTGEVVGWIFINEFDGYRVK